jgi:8-amino-7-oxononanoate synthase
MPSEFQCKFSQALAGGLQQLASRDQLRSLAEISGVNLCSNDYLGLAQNPSLREAVLEAVAGASRVGSTGSRLLSGHVAAWSDLEAEFAQFAETEAALYFTSGYAANIGLITSLAGASDLIFSDELNHASLIDGIRLSGAQKAIYAHLDLNMLESFLRAHQHAKGRKFIITETVFSMDGDVAPLAEILVLANRYNAAVILDEAHATAVHGPNGRGIAAQHRAQHGDSGNIVAAVHTCGKALASAGAFICGSAALKDHLLNHARTFIFTTALPPYLAAQIRAALRLARPMDEQRTSLAKNAQTLRDALAAQGSNTAASKSQIIPVVIGKNDRALSAARFLQQEGFAVRAIRPPTVPEGTARLRLSLTTSIAPGDLSRLARCLQKVRSDFSVSRDVSASWRSAPSELDDHKAGKAASSAAGRS